MVMSRYQFSFSERIGYETSQELYLSHYDDV